jgi:hypothetical protein
MTRDLLFSIDSAEFGFENLNQNRNQIFFVQWDAGLDRGHGQVCILANSSPDENLATRHCHTLAVDDLFCWSSHNADVCSLDLSTAVGAAARGVRIVERSAIHVELDIHTIQSNEFESADQQ